MAGPHGSCLCVCLRIGQMSLGGDGGDCSPCDLAGSEGESWLLHFSPPFGVVRVCLQPFP